MKSYSYLALGDSYTVGDQVNLASSFPYQVVQLLRKEGLNYCAPEIVAASGWTTNELMMAMEEQMLLPNYDIVSVLIGVNNQYQGRTAEEFRVHFRTILDQSIQLAHGIAKHVIVLSIPDWGFTPFALQKSPEKVSSEIDTFNFICQAEAEHFQTHFIDITRSQRDDVDKEGFLAPDQLHPSGKEYSKWARLLADIITMNLDG